MQTAEHNSEIFAAEEVGDIGVVFHSEDDIAETIGANEWVNPCGHDCCTCDRECK